MLLSKKSELKKQQYFRNLSILETVLVDHKSTTTEIGTKFNISKNRVRQICQKFIRIMSHPSRLKEPIPEVTEWNIREIRQYAHFWLKQLEKLKRE